MQTTETDLELIQHLDFEETIGCEIAWDPDSNEATHVVRCRYCAFSILVCVDHLRRCREAKTTWFCSGCGTKRKPFPVLYEVIPIGSS